MLTTKIHTQFLFYNLSFLLKDVVLRDDVGMRDMTTMPSLRGSSMFYKQEFS